MLDRLLNDDAFEDAKAEFEALTKELTISILEVDTSEAARINRELVKTVTSSEPTKLRVEKLFRFVQPKPEDFNTTSNQALLEKAEKGTDHHALYKEMQKLDADQKARLSEKLGVSLTQFVVCSLILLYTEGNKFDVNKGVRNMFALGRKVLDAVYHETDRNLKLEFFSAMLMGLYQNRGLPENFVDEVRQSSGYSKANNETCVSYLAIITGGVNVQNALKLFDKNTLEIFEGKTNVLASTSTSSNMFQRAVPGVASTTPGMQNK